jgi:hypothetical protein
MDKFTVMDNDLYQRMKAILEDNLLFGQADKAFGIPSMGPDDLNNTQAGYGVLGMKSDLQWHVYKHIMETPELKMQFFS